MVKDFLYTPASLAALEETVSTQALASLLCNRKPTSPDRVLTKLSRRQAHTPLDRLRTLRNRIAHHEPIFGRVRSKK